MKNTKKIIVMIVVIIWVASFFALRLKKIDIGNKIQNMVTAGLVNFGYSNSSAISMARNGSDVPLLLKFITKTSSGVSYMVEHGNGLGVLPKKKLKRQL